MDWVAETESSLVGSVSWRRERKIVDTYIG